jgi:hypothetical protein
MFHEKGIAMESPMPTLRPSGPLCAAIALAALTAACDKGPTAPAPAPVAPTPAAPPPGPQTATRLSGVVYEHTAEGARPKAGIWVWVAPVPSFTETGVPVGMGPSATVTSDIAGRYEVSVPYGQSVAAVAGGHEVSQPCRASLTVTGNAVLDLHIVPNTGLSATRLPPTLPIPGPTLSGTVFERTKKGSRPLPGVRLSLVYTDEGTYADIGGQFVTDSDGRYFFCDLKFAEAPYMSVWYSAPGYRSGSLGVREPGVLDIEMIRILPW